MSEQIREQLHQLVDQLDPGQLLAVRLYIDDLEPAAPRARTVKAAGRISLDDYRRKMGLTE